MRRTIERQLSRKPTLLPGAASGAIGHDLPFTKHPATGSFMRIRDVRESSRDGDGSGHARTTANGRSANESRREFTSANAIVASPDFGDRAAEVTWETGTPTGRKSTNPVPHLGVQRCSETTADRSSVPQTQNPADAGFQIGEFSPTTDQCVPAPEELGGVPCSVPQSTPFAFLETVQYLLRINAGLFLLSSSACRLKLLNNAVRAETTGLLTLRVV